MSGRSSLQHQESLEAAGARSSLWLFLFAFFFPFVAFLLNAKDFCPSPRHTASESQEQPLFAAFLLLFL